MMGKGEDTSYPSLSTGSHQITSNKDKEEAFNKFVWSHSNTDEANAQLPDEHDFPKGLTIVASGQEVYDLINSIHPSKVTGPDGISPRLLRETYISIVPFLADFINLSIASAKVPHSWTLIHVIPLFKNGAKSDTNNCRPVSLLSCVNKILEQIVFKHLFNYLQSRVLISYLPINQVFSQGVLW